MTISDQLIAPVRYTAGGASPNFTFSHPFLSQSEIKVYQIPASTGVLALKTLTTDYTISGTADSAGNYTNGATVVMNSTPPSGDIIIIERAINKTQSADYSASTSFPAETHEQALDKAIMLVQDTYSRVGRCISVPRDVNTSTVDLETDVPAALEVLRMNAAGDGFEWIDSVNLALATSVTPTDGVFLVGDGSDFVGESGATARASLGVTIGTDVQAYDAGLASIAGLTTAADKMIYTTALDTYAVADLSSFARTVLDDTTASAARTTLGLAIGTDVQAYDAELAALAGLTSAADKLPYFTGSGTASLADFTAAGRALLDDANATAQLTTLGFTASITELNYTDGVTSAIQTQLDAKQPLDAELTALAGLTSAADKVPYFTGSGTADVFDATTYGRSLLNVANEAAFKALVNLEIGTDVQAQNAFLATLASQGDVAIADIDATGTPGSGNFLRGDGTWSTPSGAGDVTGPGTSTQYTIPTWSATNNDLTDGIAIGTSGQVLTSNGAGSAATFQDAVSGGLVYLSSVTASSSATADFTSSIDSTYDTYMFIGTHIIPVTDGVLLRVLTDENGGASFDATGYQYNLNLWGAGIGVLEAGDAAATYIQLGHATYPTGSDTGEALSFVMYLHGPASTTAVKHIQAFVGYKSSGAALISGVVTGMKSDSTGAINAVRFLFSSGNIESGTIRMYGVVKS